MANNEKFGCCGGDIDVGHVEGCAEATPVVTTTGALPVVPGVPPVATPATRQEVDELRTKTAKAVRKLNRAIKASRRGNGTDSAPVVVEPAPVISGEVAGPGKKVSDVAGLGLGILNAWKKKPKPDQSA